MKQLHFSKNWNNKLNCDTFTTLRKHKVGQFIVGDEFQIVLGSKLLGIAILKDVRQVYIDDLNDYICYLDTGFDKNKTVKILKDIYADFNVEKDLLDYCLFEYKNNESKPTYT